MSETSKRADRLPSTRHRGIDTTLMTKIFPKLILWRFLVFYAPFFKGPNFSSPFLPDVDQHASRDRSPPLGKTLTRISTQTTNRYAAHKAIQYATTLLKCIEDEMIATTSPFSLRAFEYRYELEKLTYLSQGKFLKMTSGIPTVKAMLSISKTLNIPIRQLESAMSIYTHYKKQNTNTASNSLLESHEPFSVLRLIARKQYATLAQTLHDDEHDLKLYSHLLNLTLLTPSTTMTNYAFKMAVKACRVSVFVYIDYVGPDGCTCGCRGRYRYWFQLLYRRRGDAATGKGEEKECLPQCMATSEVGYRTIAADDGRGSEREREREREREGRGLLGDCDGERVHVLSGSRGGEGEETRISWQQWEEEERWEGPQLDTIIEERGQR